MGGFLVVVRAEVRYVAGPVLQSLSVLPTAYCIYYRTMMLIHDDKTERDRGCDSTFAASDPRSGAAGTRRLTRMVCTMSYRRDARGTTTTLRDRRDRRVDVSPTAIRLRRGRGTGQGRSTESIPNGESPPSNVLSRGGGSLLENAHYNTWPHDRPIGGGNWGDIEGTGSSHRNESSRDDCREARKSLNWRHWTWGASS